MTSRRALRALVVAATLLAGSCATFQPARRSAHSGLAIAHVNVVDVGGGPTLTDRTVIIEDGKVTQIVAAAGAVLSRSIQIVDGRGKYLIPGLWDMHVHLSLTEASVLPMFAAYGVTAVRDVGSRPEDTQQMRESIAAGRVIGPRIFTSGPILESDAWMQAAYKIAPPESAIWRGAPRVIVTAATATDVVNTLQRSGVDLIKARNVSGQDFLALAAAAERAGIPLASHNPNRVDMAAAARAGLDSFEHAESIWGDFGSLSVADRARMFASVATTGAMVTPTLMADVGLVVSSDETILSAVADQSGARDPRNRELPAPMRALWRDALEQRRLYGAHPAGTFENITRDVRAMREAGIVMLAGTDVGGIPLVYPGSSLHQELQLLVREGGLSPLQALQTATRNPPMFFDRKRTPGTITQGMVADLVILDADPLSDIANTEKISAVILRGKLLDRSALDGLRVLRD